MSSQIAKLLSFVRSLSNDAKVSDVEVDVGGGDNKTAQHFSAPGDDSFPLKTDYVFTSDVPRKGGKVAHGYLDPVNDPVALEGDKRIYGRHPTTGEAVNQVWLKRDGSVVVSNNNGSFELTVSGDFVINGVTISAAGVVTIPSSLIVDGKEHAGHTHPQANDSAGDTQVNTGGNL